MFEPICTLSSFSVVISLELFQFSSVVGIWRKMDKELTMEDYIFNPSPEPEDQYPEAVVFSHEAFKPLFPVDPTQDEKKSRSSALCPPEETDPVRRFVVGLPVIQPRAFRCPTPASANESCYPIEMLSKKVEKREWHAVERVPTFLTREAQYMLSRRNGDWAAFMGVEQALTSPSIGLTPSQREYIWSMLTSDDNNFSEEQVHRMFQYLRPAMDKIDPEKPDPKSYLVRDLADLISCYLFRPVSNTPAERDIGRVIRYLYCSFCCQIRYIPLHAAHGFASFRTYRPSDKETLRRDMPWMPVIFLLPIPLLDIYGVHTVRNRRPSPLMTYPEILGEAHRVYFSSTPSVFYFTRVIWKAFLKVYKEAMFNNNNRHVPQETRERLQQEVASAYGVKLADRIKQARPTKARKIQETEEKPTALIAAAMPETNAADNEPPWASIKKAVFAFGVQCPARTSDAMKAFAWVC